MSKQRECPIYGENPYYHSDLGIWIVAYGVTSDKDVLTSNSNPCLARGGRVSDNSTCLKCGKCFATSTDIGVALMTAKERRRKLFWNMS